MAQNATTLNATNQRQERRGLALPAVRSVGGYFASKSVHDTAWGDLLLALFTRIGGRVMLRTYGSGLHLLQFEPQDPRLLQQTIFVINDTASQHVPHVRIQNVQVNSVGEILRIKVSFSLVDDGLTEDRLMELPRDQIIRFLASQRIT